MLQILRDVQTIVADFPEQTRYVHSEFVFDAQTAYLVPLRQPEDPFPMVLSNFEFLRLSADLARRTAKIHLDYLMPHHESQADVPEIYAAADEAINTILYRLLHDFGYYQLISDILMREIRRKGSQRLAGCNAQFLLTTPNTFTLCCTPA